MVRGMVLLQYEGGRRHVQKSPKTVMRSYSVGPFPIIYSFDAVLVLAHALYWSSLGMLQSTLPFPRSQLQLMSRPLPPPSTTPSVVLAVHPKENDATNAAPFLYISPLHHPSGCVVCTSPFLGSTSSSDARLERD